MTDAQDQQGAGKHLLEYSTRRPPTAEGCYLSEHTHTVQLWTLATWTDDDLNHEWEIGLKTPKSLFPPQHERGAEQAAAKIGKERTPSPQGLGTGAFSAHGKVAPEDLGNWNEIAAAGFCR